MLWACVCSVCVSARAIEWASVRCLATDRNSRSSKGRPQVTAQQARALVSQTWRCCWPLGFKTRHHSRSDAHACVYSMQILSSNHERATQKVLSYKKQTHVSTICFTFFLFSPVAVVFRGLLLIYFLWCPEKTMYSYQRNSSFRSMFTIYTYLFVFDRLFDGSNKK